MSSRHFERVFSLLDQHLWVITSQVSIERGGLIATLVRKVSLTPLYPRILLGLAKHHYTHSLVSKSRAFACHLFTEHQLEWVSRFGTQCGRDFDKLAGQRLSSGQTGSPILEEALAWLDCRVQVELDVGDRVIYVAQVVDASLKQENAIPLTFNRLMQIAPEEMRAQLTASVKADCLLDEAAVREWLDARNRFVSETNDF